jgi:hypothetical protein
MKRMKVFIWPLISGFMLLASACGTSYEEPDTAIEAGRQFISAIYNGNFKRAGQLIVQDEANKTFLENEIEKDFRSRDGFGKESLSKASIQVNKIITIDSNHTVVHFKNAYTGSDAQLNIIRQGGLWRINLLKLP